MTANPFFPQQPQAPAPYGQPQGYPAPQQYAPPPAPAYGQPPQGPGPYGQPQGYYPPQQQGFYGQPPAPPQAPAVQGNLAGFDSQPSGGSGPGISWKDAPIGTTRVMAVKREVRDSDVKQDTQPQSQGGALKFRKDGSPLWVLTVPVFVQPDAEHPDGDATLYVRAGIRDALVEAYGGDLRPKAGDVITLTLTERKAIQNAAIPKNIFRATVQRADGSTPAPQAPAAPAQPPVQAPQPPAAPVPPQAPAQQWTPPPPVHSDQGPAAQQLAQGTQAWTAPVVSTATGQPVVHQQEVPAPPQAPALPGLPQMDPAQLALLERLRGGAQA